MADKKISELVEHTALSATDVFPVVDSGASATKRVTYDTLATEVRTESEPLTATTITASGDITSNGETVYHRGNILGTVSQSGGTPTGAVIERGSNANGQYVKYADGTMICSVQKPTELVNGGTSSIGPAGSSNFKLGTWTYPATFTVAPVVVGSAADIGAGLFWGSLFNLPGVSSAGYTLNGANSDAAWSGVAIGRWF